MDAHQLRHLAGREELTGLQLHQLLGHYSQPRDKIKRLLAANELIRVKQGIYVFGPSVARHPYSTWVLAQWIYGPSAISCHSACSFHGLIPEQVVAITSITPKRDKWFDTPVGTFSYRYLHPKKFSVGLMLLESEHAEPVLMASPEKAVCDLITLSVTQHRLHDQDLDTFLFSDLRLDEHSLFSMDFDLLNELCQAYNNRYLWMLYRYLTARSLP